MTANNKSIWILLFTLFFSVLQAQITTAEYFWDTDPGQGSGTAMSATDGSFNSITEAILKSNSSVPASLGYHKLGVRVRDGNNNWGPVHYTVLHVHTAITASTRSTFVQQAEFFWDTDPGAGNATTVLATDGSFNETVEDLMKTNIATPANGLHKFGMRVKDADNNWGPVHYTVVSIQNMPTATADSMRLKQAEYFWDTDPGQGNATAVLASDGNINEMTEELFQSNLPYPSSAGLHKFGIRVRDVNNNWGPVHYTILNVMASNPILTGDKKLLQSEYFWDTDPGQGNGTTVFATDGNFDESIELINKIVGTNTLTLGPHVFWVRVKDLNGNWGPKHGTAVYIDVSLVPVVLNMTGNQNFCSTSLPQTTNYTAVLSGSPTSINWTIIGGTITSGAGTATVTVTWNPGAYHSIKVSACNSNGCGNADSIVPNIITLPVVSFSGLNTNYCSYDAPSTLSPSVGGGTFSGSGMSGNTFNPSVATATSVVTYSYTQSGCTATYNDTAYVTQNVNVSFSGLNNVYCSTAPTATLTASPSGGTFSGSGVSGNTFNPATANDTSVVMYTYTTAGCSYSTSSTVYVGTPVSVNFSGLNNAYCSYDAASVLTPNVGGGSFSGSGISGNTFNPAFASGTTVVYYTYTNTGCVNSYSDTTFVTANPNVSFSGLTSVYCSSDAAVTLTPSPIGGTFSGSGISGNTFDPASAIGTSTVSYTYVTGGCTYSASSAVSVGTAFSVSYSGLNSTYCSNDASSSLSPTVGGGSFSGSGMFGSVFDPSGLSGQYIIQYNVSANGCSASYTDTTQVFTSPATPIVSGVFDTLYSSVGASYQWVDCNNGFAAISGETNQYFVPSLAGSYAVVISNGSCSNMSSCYNYFITNAESVSSAAAYFSIYPNPANTIINLTGNIHDIEQIEVFSTEGKLVMALAKPGSNVINIAQLSAGLYSVKIICKEKFHYVKFIKH